jgi:hypothetical protein
MILKIVSRFWHGEEPVWRWLTWLAFWLISISYMTFSFVGGTRTADMGEVAIGGLWRSVALGLAYLLYVAGTLLWLYFSFFFICYSIGAVMSLS